MFKKTLIGITVAAVLAFVAKVIHATVTED